MVFEALVADLLNRFLGDYIENLDSKQLNVGIWGGDVVLRNLDIRPTALVSAWFCLGERFGWLDGCFMSLRNFPFLLPSLLRPYMAVCMFGPCLQTFSREWE